MTLRSFPNFMLLVILAKSCEALGQRCTTLRPSTMNFVAVHM